MAQVKTRAQVKQGRRHAPTSLREMRKDMRSDRSDTHLDADLSSRDGRIMALFECAGWLASAGDSEPRTAPARAEAERLISEVSA